MDKLTYIIALHQGRIQGSRFNFLSPGTPLQVHVVAHTAVCSSDWRWSPVVVPCYSRRGWEDRHRKHLVAWQPFSVIKLPQEQFIWAKRDTPAPSLQLLTFMLQSLDTVHLHMRTGVMYIDLNIQLAIWLDK